MSSGMIARETAMSVIEDGRQLVQDFLAPERRSISSRLDALEKRYESLDRKVEQVDARAEKRSDEFLKHFEKRHDEVMAAIAKAADYNSLLAHLAKLEAKDKLSE